MRSAHDLFIWRYLIYALGFLSLAYGLMPCIGLTYDSYLHLETAEKLSKLGFYQSGFEAKPPLYSLILKLFDNQLWMVMAFNLICWIGSVRLIDKIFQDLFHESINLTLIGASWIAFSTPLHLVHNFAWAEPLFLMLVLLFLLELNKASDRNFVLLSFITLAMVSTRYLGLLFILGGAMTLLVSKNLRWKDSFWICSGTFFFASWQGFIRQMRGDFKSMSFFTGLNGSDNYMDLGKSLSHWLVPVDWDAFNYVVPFAAISFFIFAFFSFNHVILKTLAATSLWHLVMILTKGDLIYADIERYLFFIHPFLIAFMAPILLDPRRWLRYPFIALSIAVLVYSLIRTVKNDLFWHHSLCQVG